MAFYKGQGGRPKGAKGKRTDLHAKCAEIGIDVFTELLEMANSEIDPHKRFNKFKELAAYLYARPKEEMDLNQFTPEEIRDYLISLVKSVPSGT